jgi:hypothetical protein
MKRTPVRHLVLATIVLLGFAGQETWALAGVTGGLSGTVVSADTSAPLAGAQVIASSPSQTATTTTDASGHFTFLTLAPDTYTVNASKAGYQAVSAPGQTVFADTVQTVTIRLLKALKTIAHVSAASAGALVKSGTTADVYSINATTQHAAAALGGGMSLNSAYSAVASAPGAYVPPNQMGYFQTVMIRGGDYDQVGYEFDGVPINRSFDNYPSSSASSLGNAEVQVYTGAPPPNSESAGLSGYINQVIKTGTYPGYGTGSLGIGTPAFYHRASIEVGGATPDRNFSYYVGVAGFNQDFRELDNDNGSSYDSFVGVPMGFTGNAAYAPDPNGIASGRCPGNGNGLADTCQYYQGAINYASAAWNAIRDVVANVHIGIPHKSDAGRDDVQLLWDSEMALTGFYNTTNDIVSTQGCSGPSAASGAACANAIGIGTPVYVGGVQWSCPSMVGHAFSQAALAGQASCVTPYSFPSSGVAPFTTIPYTASDTMRNNQEIVKVQYTKNFGSTAFLRVYGYTYYSDWIYNAPQSTFASFAACCPSDYELSSHTRGISANFQDQIDTLNLLSFQASYVTSTSVRDNNEFFLVSGETAAPIVSAANPYGGVCYGTAPNGKFGPVACSTQWTGAPGNYGGLTFPQIQSASTAPFPSLTGESCGGAPCQYLLAENGQSGTYNSITPRFFATSFTDQIRPSDKWLFNVGVRLDSFTFIGADTDTGMARDFWTNAFNLDNCINSITGAPVSKTLPGGLGLSSPMAACPSGYVAAAWQNTPANFTYNIWQPRIAGTYTANPDNVIRFSYGRYPEAPDSAYEQYDTSQENLAAYDAANFYQFGRTSPGYPIVPPTSLNYDLSWEHHFRGTDWSFKATPFLRQTQDQIQLFYLNQKTSFVSGLNVGSQRSQGLEFSLQKGDFSRNGFSGTLSFTYTNSYIRYGTFPSGLYGASVISGTNDAISAYNAFTKNCAPNGAWVGKIGPNHVPYCGTATNASGATVEAAPCYTTAGAPVYACTSADVGNPYWNNPQTLIDPTQDFPTFSLFPGGVGSSAAGSGVPYVTALVVNYKDNKLAITPSLQFFGGGKYGYPQSMPGINPAACSGILPVVGSNGGSRYNALDCSNTLAAIPDTYTNVFDPLGAFTQPNNLLLNLQLTYDASPNITLTGVLANIVNTCWGGTKAPWTYQNDGNVCGYIAGGFEGEIMPVGNVYNPAGYAGSIVQQFRKYPYSPILGPYNQDAPELNSDSVKTPFQFYVTANIKI